MPVSNTCEGCGASFETTLRASRFCGTKCRSKGYYESNRSGRLESQKSYQEGVGREKYLSYQQGWKKSNPSYMKEWHLQTNYGLSIKELGDLLESQGSQCKICKTPLDLSKRKAGLASDAPVVDHCHTTGKVCGILCSSCNTGIGYLKEDVGNLESAITYLKNTGKASKK